MSRLSFRPPALSLAVAAGALALAACSDSPLSPSRSLRSSDASLSVTPGTNSLTIVSDGSTLFCTGLNGDYTIPTTFTATGCGAGTVVLGGYNAANVPTLVDPVTAPLATYNPGWSIPFTGSSWIGFDAKGGPSNEYRANPGRYVYQESFSVPTGVTNPVLDIHVKADNVAAVYLNGTLVGAQDNTDCNPDVVTCNWNGDLHIVQNLTAGTAYTLTFLVIDLPTGAFSSTPGVGGSAPQYGCTTRFPQATGTLGWSATTVATVPNHVVTGGGTGVGITNLGAANQAGCENPTGLDFAGTVTWTSTVLQWCSPGFWKTHLEAWSLADQQKLYSTLTGAAPLSKKAPAGDPNLVTVVSNPNTYGGPAANSVADYLSGIAFGSNVGTSADDSRCNNGIPLTPIS